MTVPCMCVYVHYYICMHDTLSWYCSPCILYVHLQRAIDKHSTLITGRQLHVQVLVLPGTLRQWFSLSIVLTDSCASTTVAPNIAASITDDSEGLCVLEKLFHRGVFMNSPSLSLLSKKFLKWILTDSIAHEH